jgi:hypothetical protein
MHLPVIEKVARHYAGVGSRETPQPICDLMTDIAKKLEGEGWILRSGGAAGADSAFEAGVSNPANMQIFLPSSYFNGRSSKKEGYIDASKLESLPKAMKTVDLFHPAPSRLSDFARNLMARNAMQVLGASLEEPSQFVMAWTIGGKVAGGTGQALRIANFYKIPVLNLGDPATEAAVRGWVEGKVDTLPFLSYTT